MSRPHFKPDPADPLITTRKAAEFFGVTLRTIQNWCDAGKLPFIVTPGRHRRLRLSHVTALQQQRSGGTGPLPEITFPFADKLVEKALEQQTAQIVAYLNHMADQPTGQPTRAFWCREIAGLISNGAYKPSV